MSQLFEVRELRAEDHAWLPSFIERKWGSQRVVSRGRVHYPAKLEGFVAIKENKPVGLLTYRVDNRECEIVTIDSDVEGVGVGSGLIEAVTKTACSSGCVRVWLITTNDNTPALKFYQKRGFRLAALYPNALEESRKLKPEIPLSGLNGIPLRDEIELEVLLEDTSRGRQK